MSESESANREAQIERQRQFCDELHRQKYRDPHQTKGEHAEQLALNMATDAGHRRDLTLLFEDDSFLAAGRVQAACGSERESSPFNCAVSGTIDDSMDGIMSRLKEAAMTLRLGTGIGYDFSTLRPEGSTIRTLKSESSGPLSFMGVYDAMCKTVHIKHRRGAQMGVMNIHHPDIMKFIRAKMNSQFSCFNLSVGITDEFMRAVKEGAPYALRFPVKGGPIVAYENARYVWNTIMQCAWDSAEPGVLFLDHINDNNNLYYCEDIVATNPCAEQPLPPYGMCLLGSFNLTKYVDPNRNRIEYDKLNADCFTIVEAYDNIFDRAMYALPEHKEEALNKRRMGIGLTGIANAVEMVTNSGYGDPAFCNEFRVAARVLRNSLYDASIRLARRRGPFPAFDRDAYCDGRFFGTLPAYLQQDILRYGIRNSHLISYAPCGTISRVAGQVSSGVEPVFYHRQMNNINLKGEVVKVEMYDHAYLHHGFKGRTLEECTIDHHLDVLEIAQTYCDSAVSKTINVPPSITFEQYSEVYMQAYERGSKGLTVYRPNEIRAPVITKSGDCDGGECKFELAATA